MVCSCLSESSKAYTYGSTSSAFIFSLRNNEGLGPFKSMVKKPLKAILKHQYLGPTFGTHDIRIDRSGDSKEESSTSNFGSDYFPISKKVKNNRTILAGVDKFHPDEVEVFYLKVTKKSTVDSATSSISKDG